MGIFKQIRDMKDMANAAPGLVEQAQQMGAQAQQMAAAQRAAAQAQMAQYGGAQPGAFGQQAGAFGQPAAPAAPTAPTGPDFEPIENVSLGQFAAVTKAVAAYNYDGSRLPEIAASKGIPAYAWETACNGWNERIKANPAVAQRYNQLYRAS
jgi:hypothetical protein